jgi:hypothetical protein
MLVLTTLVLLSASLSTVAFALTRDDDDHARLRSTSAERALRAFEPNSWWNTPLPDHTPLEPRAKEVLDYLRTGPDSARGCLVLGGAGESPWGVPMYWSTPSDPTYRVKSTGRRPLPPEFSALRIPRDARVADNADGSIVVYDLTKRYVVAMTHAVYESAANTWSASGGTVTYLDSNGLHVGTGRSDDPRNQGSHRGNNGATMAVSWDQVRAGQIRHVLKVAAGPPLGESHVFPMVGSDGQLQGSGVTVIPQGLRLRIKSSVDLEALNLNPQALVIARALQRYGMYIGDSGGVTGLKLEDTRLEGRSQLWTLRPDALCSLRFEPRFWDVVAEAYDPTQPTAANRRSIMQRPTRSRVGDSGVD